MRNSYQRTRHDRREQHCPEYNIREYRGELDERELKERGSCVIGCRPARKQRS